jgi:thioredoxin 1
MSKETIEVNDANFKELVLQSNTPVMVDFWAPWCGPCNAIAPTLDALAAEYKGRLIIAKLNIDENKDVPVEYGVRSIPFLAIFKGGKLMTSHTGTASKAKFVALIEHVLHA